MFNRRYHFLYILIFCFSILSTGSQAAVQLDLDYSLKMEQHTDIDDRMLSDFIVTLDDSYLSNQFSIEADLVSDFIYEHRSEEDSVLVRGDISANYRFNQTFSWILESQFSEINKVIEDDFDELNSQTVVNTATGLVFDRSRGLRGGVIARLLATKYSYDHSPLDADEQSLELAYLYPFNSSSNLRTSFSFVKQEYDDADESLNDVETDSFGVSYLKQFSFVTTEVFFEQSDIEYLNQEQNEEVEIYGISISYRINSRSLIALEFAHDLQQTFDLNSTLADPQNPVLTSGLVENDRYTIHYSHVTNQSNFRLELYQNDLEDVSDSGNVSGQQDGFIVEHIQHLNEKLDIELLYEDVKNEVSVADIESTTISLRYLISESARYTTSTRLNVEERNEESGQEDDVGLIFEVRASIF